MKPLLLALSLALLMIATTLYAGGIGLDMTLELTSTGGGAGGEPPSGGTLSWIDGNPAQWIDETYADFID
jgi:hypothetical protein